MYSRSRDRYLSFLKLEKMNPLFGSNSNTINWKTQLKEEITIVIVISEN